MVDGAVRLMYAAQTDPATGLAAQIAAAPGIPAGVTLPASVRVVGEDGTAWVARRACDARELDAGPLLVIHADEAALPLEQATDEVPWMGCRVSVSYLVRGDDPADMAAQVAAARHVERAALAALLAYFATPLRVVNGVTYRRPFVHEIERLTGFEPWGDAVSGATLVATIPAVDTWGYV